MNSGELSDCRVTESATEGAEGASTVNRNGSSRVSGVAGQAIHACQHITHPVANIKHFYRFYARGPDCAVGAYSLKSS